MTSKPSSHVLTVSLLATMALCARNRFRTLVLDIADWQQPTELAHCDTSGPEDRLGAIIQDIQLVDHRLYLAFDQGRMSVLDVSRPRNPTLVAHSAPGFGPEVAPVAFHGLAEADGYVLIVSDPAV